MNSGDASCIHHPSLCVCACADSESSGVGAGAVTVTYRDKTTATIAFGTCIWATGIAMHPLVKQIQALLPLQTHWRAVTTDDRLRVAGSGGSIWALGDAGTIDASLCGGSRGRSLCRA